MRSLRRTAWTQVRPRLGPRRRIGVRETLGAISTDPSEEVMSGSGSFASLRANTGHVRSTPHQRKCAGPADTSYLYQLLTHALQQQARTPRLVLFDHLPYPGRDLALTFGQREAHFKHGPDLTIGDGPVPFLGGIGLAALRCPNAICISRIELCRGRRTTSL